MAALTENISVGEWLLLTIGLLILIVLAVFGAKVAAFIAGLLHTIHRVNFFMGLVRDILIFFGWVKKNPASSRIPRTSGPTPRRRTTTVVTNPITGPAGAGQPTAQQQNDGWPKWMSAIAPIIVSLLVFAALLATNITPLYYTGAHPQLPNVWVLMQGVLALLVGVIVWMWREMRALKLDIRYMQTTHAALKRPENWAPPVQQPQPNP